MYAPAQDGPCVTSTAVRFSLRDPEGVLSGVRLWHESEISRPDLTYEFERAAEDDAGAWRLRLPRPDVDRLEYQFEVTGADGGTRFVLDPANPRRAPGPFGEKSVVEFPEYRPPAWLDGADRNPPRGDVIKTELQSAALLSPMEVWLWSSPGSRPRARLPLLVVHDGPEYAQYSALLDMLDRLTASGALPAMRAALLAPGRRNRNYSASAAYARALADDLLPAVRALAPSAGLPVGLGSSLGALAMLHAQRRRPGLLAAMFLQSGSFFRPSTADARFDFTRDRRITRFVGEVLAARACDDPVPVAMTCGALEKNLANSRAMRDALALQGYDARLHVGRDLHNWVAWRDLFDPHLVALLERLWT
jgi:enterochelin esterase-like enzyme